MPQVILDPLGLTITVESRRSLLLSLERAKVDLAAVCGGQGTCGTCVLRVIEGGNLLTPMDDLERSTLMNTHQDPLSCRLTCQAAIVSDQGQITLHLNPRATKKLLEILKRLENRLAPRPLCHPITGQEIVAQGQPITRAALEHLLSYS